MKEDILLTYTSNAIEGNCLTLEETKRVINGEHLEDKPLKDQQEALNHYNALQLVRRMKGIKPHELKESHLLGIHAAILKSIDDPNAGKYRRVSVRIAGSTVTFPDALQVPDLMREFMDWLQTATLHPVELAILAHYKLVTIHPFVDGNGRTARLLMNLLLMMYGSPPAVIRPEDRLEYINALESAQLGGSLDAFITVVTEAVNSSLDAYLYSGGRLG